MSEGVRAELAVHEPANCPLASLAAESDAPVTDVTWAAGGDAVAEEFRVAADAIPADAAALDSLSPVVDVGDERVYRFERDPDVSCACELVESLGSPVADVRLRDGTLVLTLHLADVERLRAVVAELASAAERIELRYLVHTGGEDAPGADPTFVDRARLTDRQREVLRTAHAMGYFEYPREANATAVADELGIGVSTFAEHLAAAQRVLLGDLLRE
jgi:predicted DNA binding protein